MFVFSAAGFIATSTSGRSPGVRMSWSAKCSWKPDTPGSEPAGARISAGKSGNVARSFPAIAVSEVNRPPVSCIPSPESPAKRMTTESSCSTGLATTSLTLTAAPAFLHDEGRLSPPRSKQREWVVLRRRELALGAHPVLVGVSAFLEMDVVRTRRDVVPRQDERLTRLLRAARRDLLGCRLLRRGGLGGLAWHCCLLLVVAGCP